jgi:thiamine-phosphate pyrophosphorylase
MQRRQPLPRLWLMTDERQGDALWTALRRLPRCSGVVFRHYGLPRTERLALFEQVRALCRRRHLLLVLAGAGPSPNAWRADGRHGPGLRRSPGLRTAPAHNAREIRAAERAGAALVFLSPVFPTQSHPGAPVLGRARFGLLARQARIPVIALGGMDQARGRGLPGAYGWAAIDAWTRGRARASPLRQSPRRAPCGRAG